MRKAPKLPADPRDPAIRFMLAEAEVQALFNVALWLVRDLARDAGGLARALAILNTPHLGEDFAPFGIDYDADGNEVISNKPQNWALPPFEERKKVRAAAVRRIDFVMSELRRCAVEMPNDTDEE